MKVPTMILTVGLVVGTATSASPDTTTDLNNQATKMNTLATSQGESNVTNKISGDFKSFLGSDSNAVVTGLRNGTPIKLTSTTTTPSTTSGGLPVTTTTTTTITPPTGQMGITEPTPQQLQAALTGGTITQTSGTGATATTTTTELPGILTLRSQNMGWGKIAQTLETKLGPVMSSMKSANQSLANTTAAASKGSSMTNASGQRSGSSDSGIVSGSGKSHGNSGQGMSSGKGSSSGIVTASGRGSDGHAYGRSSGIVTGSGRGGGSVGGAAAGGGSDNGAAHGGGHGK